MMTKEKYDVPLKLMVSRGQMEALQAIKTRSGMPLNEQLRRLMVRWIAEQEAQHATRQG
jgi:hypothetical protein